MTVILLLLLGTIGGYVAGFLWNRKLVSEKIRYTRSFENSPLAVWGILRNQLRFRSEGYYVDKDVVVSVTYCGDRWCVDFGQGPTYFNDLNEAGAYVIDHVQTLKAS